LATRRIFKQLLSSASRIGWYLLLIATSLQAQADAPYLAQVQARLATVPPSIDGRLDDPVWQEAVPIDAFYQREPVLGAPASERTVVRILYDAGHIYLAFECFDSNPQGIVANQMRRDADLGENDNVEVIFDTYNDRRGGVFFSTNPLGARRDMLLTNEGRSRNEAWDRVWTSRAQIHAAGWSAEIAIPFDQLRYAAGTEGTWGINISRTIRRKNEKVFLLPPPLSYGSRGSYRTSRLSALKGLGTLRATTPFEAVPYISGGVFKDRQAVDRANQFNGDLGFDLKYGLTPSLTADVSYNTDFAQVEADQEQVNLTRFSLFFPEKRDFFLEGAGVFEFGEGRGSSRGPPPTLLFYSRRIGIETGHSLSVLYGAKLTGRHGPYEIGVLDMLTQADTFFDEVEEQRLLSSTGELLEAEDPLLAQHTILDTVDVDVVDTLDVRRTHFSVLRLRRDLFGRSSIGFIATNRDPAAEAAHNRAAGVDLNLSLLQATLQLRGFLARSFSPDFSSKEGAGQLAVDHRIGFWENRASYLDVQQNFNPEVGFAPRADIRRYRTSTRYRPLSGVSWIRRFSLGPSFTYLTDQGGTVQSRQVNTSVFTQLEAGDWIGVRYRYRFEDLDEAFEVHKDIEIPMGDHSFSSFSLNLFSDEGRRLSGNLNLESGQFFNGTRHRLGGEIAFKVSGRLTLESDYGLNLVDLPAGSFTTNRLSNRFSFSFTPDFYVRGFVQWNSAREVVGGNFLLNYRYSPGSDLFLVYNQAWDTEGKVRQLNRAVQFKVAHFWKR
jgi:hypothetical protein